MRDKNIYNFYYMLKYNISISFTVTLRFSLSILLQSVIKM